MNFLNKLFENKQSESNPKNIKVSQEKPKSKKEISDLKPMKRGPQNVENFLLGLGTVILIAAFSFIFNSKGVSPKGYDETNIVWIIMVVPGVLALVVGVIMAVKRIKSLPQPIINKQQEPSQKGRMGQTVEVGHTPIKNEKFLSQSSQTKVIEPNPQKDSSNNVEGLKATRNVQGLNKLLRSNTNLPYIPHYEDFIRISHASALALGQIRNPQAVKFLFNALKDRDCNVRECAADVLIDNGLTTSMDKTTNAWLAVAKKDWESAISFGEVAVEPLRFCLTDSQDIRVSAAHALEKIRPTSLLTPTDKVWMAIAKREWNEIIPLGGAAVIPLTSVLKNAYEWASDMREESARVLGKINDEKAIKSLCAALGDTNERIRNIAVDSLVGFGNKAVKKLVETIQTQNNEIEERSEKAITSNILSSLERPLTHDEKIKDIEFVQEAGKIINMRHEAAKALGRIGIPVIDSLFKVLKNQNNNKGVKLSTIDALKIIPSKKIIEPLEFALKDNFYSIRTNAAEALGDIGDIHAVDPLIDLLKDENKYVREEAAKALGKLKDARAVESLTIALKDEEKSVCKEAAIALKEIENKAN